jgi:hypothetical protein
MNLHLKSPNLLNKLVSDELLPLTGAQKNVWFHQQLDLLAAGYNIGYCVHLEGPLDLDRLMAAQELLLKQFEALRCVFVEIDGEPFQKILAYQDPLFSMWDLRANSGSHAPEKIQNLLNTQFTEPFSLDSGPCVRFGLIRVSDTKSIWTFVAHHLVVDGYGLSSCLKYLTDAYARPLKSSAPSISWVNTINADLQFQSSSEWVSAKDYWHKVLEGLANPISLSGAPLNQQPIVPKIRSVYLEEENFQVLSNIGFELCGARYPVFSAAFMLYLARLSGLSDICIGMPASARNKDSRGAVGMLTNTLPLRLRFEETDTLSGLMQALSGQLRQGFKYIQYPLNQIVQERRLHGLHLVSQ